MRHKKHAHELVLDSIKGAIPVLHSGEKSDETTREIFNLSIHFLENMRLSKVHRNQLILDLQKLQEQIANNGYSGKQEKAQLEKLLAELNK